ncbi:uncharacterized protein LOC115034161 [Acyrthosiphon pisum]|uniref:THAP-type domain-containing protein n=1 Tax=Acyrthosiphon pisum TaxID=7029 RepID=A0A8R2NQS0_ACYPI|nr:uncharacterized protein LOC115034161 [Acyrthosiphon pisum]
MRRARPPGQDNTRLAAQPMAANGPALDGRGGVCGSAKTDNVKLHGFPKDINLREKWVAQIKKNVPIIINQYTRLYSKHFTNDDYYQSSFGNDILKADAVPSRFFCSRKSLLPEFEIRASMSTNKPILTVNDNLENLMLEEEIVVNG